MFLAWKSARKWGLFLGYQCLAVSALIALPELWMRLAVPPGPPLVVPSGIRHPPYFNSPGISTIPEIGGVNEFRHNRQGLRGPELAPGGESLRRILIIGDSVVYGIAVGNEETVSAQLDGMLNSGQTTRRWEVLNGGVSGYELPDTEVLFRERGLALHPDIVVVGLFRNDHVDRDVWNQAMAAAPSPTYRAAQWRRRLMDRSHLLQAAYGVLQRRFGAKYPFYATPEPLRGLDKTAIRAFFPGDAGTAGAMMRYLDVYRYSPSMVLDVFPWMLDLSSWDNIRGPLTRIRDLCRARGIRILVLVFPTQFEVFPGYRYRQPQSKVSEILTSLGLPYVDLLPVFRGTGYGDEFYKTRYDFAHPGREGYALAAQALLDKLAALGWDKPLK